MYEYDEDDTRPIEAVIAQDWTAEGQPEWMEALKSIRGLPQIADADRWPPDPRLGLCV